MFDKRTKKKTGTCTQAPTRSLMPSWISFHCSMCVCVCVCVCVRERERERERDRLRKMKVGGSGIKKKGGGNDASLHSAKSDSARVRGVEIRRMR